LQESKTAFINTSGACRTHGPLGRKHRNIQTLRSKDGCKNGRAFQI